MEQKQQDRIRRTSVPVMVQYNNTGFHRHTLSNVGLEGAFLQMGNVRVLRRHAPVKLVFVHQNNGSNNTHLIDARVRDIKESGAELVFPNLDLPAHEALLKLETNN